MNTLEQIKKQDEYIKTLDDYTKYKAKKIDDPEYSQESSWLGETVRFSKENYKDGQIFIYAKGRSRYGWRVGKDYFNKYFEVKIEKSEYEKRQARYKKAIKKLEKSGLWENILKTLKNLQTISEHDYNDMKNILYKSEWKERTDNLYKEYGDKYPFIFYKSDYDGSLCYNSDYFYGIADCTLKSMYFGKWRNKEYKAEIKEALKNKKPYETGRVRVNYDVHFSYNPEDNRAFYAEEYKDCGNGHYYIALDENTALFCEDD